MSCQYYRHLTARISDRKEVLYILLEGIDVAINIGNIEKYIKTGKFNNKVLDELREMVSFVLNNNPKFHESLSNYIGDSFLDDIVNETFPKLAKGRDKIPLTNAFWYICEIIKNVCVDVLRERNTHEGRTVLPPNDEETDEEDFLVQIVQESGEYDDESLDDMLISTISEDVLKLLIDAEIKAENLCYFIANIFDHPTNYLADKGRDARYKIVERTKKALREFAKKYSVEEEVMGRVLKLYYQTICLQSNGGQGVQQGSDCHE